MTRILVEEILSSELWYNACNQLYNNVGKPDRNGGTWRTYIDHSLENHSLTYIIFKNEADAIAFRLRYGI